MEPKERFAEVRKHYGLSMDAFGKRIGLSASGVSAIEYGTRMMNEKHIKLICAEFPEISEDWLRTGEGDMHAARSSDPLVDLCDKYHLTAMDRGIVRGFVELDADQRAAFLQIARRILDLGASEAFFEIGRSIQTHVPEPESDSVPKDRSS